MDALKFELAGPGINLCYLSQNFVFLNYEIFLVVELSQKTSMIENDNSLICNKLLRLVRYQKHELNCYADI